MEEVVMETEIDLVDFLRTAVQQTIIALVERNDLVHGELPSNRWFRDPEPEPDRPHPRMLEYYMHWAPSVGLVVPTLLNVCFNAVGEPFALLGGNHVDMNLCCRIHNSLQFIITENTVTRIVRAFVAALRESPHLNAWRHGTTIVIHCPNGATFILCDLHTNPAFLRR